MTTQMLPECTRHPEGLALLQKCKENPLDLAPRLILADWLEEQGEEIVGKAIRNTTTNQWLEYPKEFPARWSPLISCRNGWLGVHSSMISDEVLLELLRSPWLSRLNLNLDNDLAARVELLSPGLRNSQLIELMISFSGDNYHEATKKLLDIESFSSVTKLEFPKHGAFPNIQDYELLAESRLFSRVEELHLSGRISDPGVLRKLGNSSLFEKVSKLGMDCYNPFTSESIACLARSTKLNNLESLSISKIANSTRSLRLLSKSSILKGIRSLNFYSSDIDDSGIGSLMRCRHFEKLETLNLSSNMIGPNGVELLANSGDLQNLKNFNLCWNPIGDLGWTSIANAQALQKLEFLSLGSTRSGQAGVDSLANSENLSNLQHLSLRWNNVGDAIHSIASSRFFRNLTSLDLYESQIEDEGAILLIRSSLMQHLAYINLSVNRLTEKSLINFFEVGVLSKLKRIDMHYIHISDEVATKFMQRIDLFPNLNCISLLFAQISEKMRAELLDWSKSSGVKVECESLRT